MGNEIVKYNNDFNNQALRNFSSEELNLLITFFHKLKEKDTNTLEYSFYELKKLIKLEKNMTTKEFTNTVMNVNRKLLSLNYTYRESHTIVQMAIFKTFKIKLDEQILMISLNEDFKFLLNNFNKEWTRFELEEFVNLKSSYVKEFYRRMKQFRKTGFWKCNIDEFKYLLDIPKKYRIIDIDNRILKPIMKELGKEYNLQIIKKYGFNGGRGRSKVIGFEFRFWTDKQIKIQSEKEAQSEKNKIEEVETIPRKKYRIVENIFEIKEEKTLKEQIKEELEMEKEALNRSTTLLGSYIAGLKDVTNNSIIIDSKRRINSRKEKIEKLEQLSNLADDEIDESLEKEIRNVLEMEIR